MAEQARRVAYILLDVASLAMYRQLDSARLNGFIVIVSFMKQLYHDIQKFSNYCKKRGIQPCVRLNVLPIFGVDTAMPHKMNIFQSFPKYNSMTTPRYQTGK